jgi:hypothetical protein
VTLQQDINDFFARVSPITAARNVQWFNDGVDKHVTILLLGEVIDLSDALNDMTNTDPQWTMEFIQLWTRAVAAKSQAQLLERKIDVRKVLTERVRLGKAKLKVNKNRRRII